MLQKFKFFNKEKPQQQQPNQQQQQSPLPVSASNKNHNQSKRTSSSSGFSSTRSERSDSSLSLNDGHVSQIKPPTVTAIAMIKTRETKTLNKQSKISDLQTKKDSQGKSTLRNEKKEKSPITSITNSKDSSMENKLLTTNRNKASSANKGPNDKGFTKSSPNTKSIGKASLPTNKTLNSPNNNTHPPKPIAAIKGTSKVTLSPNQNEIKQATYHSNISTETIERKEKHLPTTHPSKIPDHNTISSSNANLIPSTFKTIPTIPSNLYNKSPYYANSTNISRSQLKYKARQPCATFPDGQSALFSPHKSPSSPQSLNKDFQNNSNIRILDHQQHNSPFHEHNMYSLDHSQSITTTLELNELNANKKFHTAPTKAVSTHYSEEQSINTNTLPTRFSRRGYLEHTSLPSRRLRSMHTPSSDIIDSKYNQGYYSDEDSLLHIPSLRYRHCSTMESPNRHRDSNGYLSDSGLSIPHSTHGKFYLGMMRAGNQLPTTLEER